jgi:hypothetical protein
VAVTDKTPDLAVHDGPRLVPAASIRRRARLERTIYGAATLGIAIAPHYDQLWPAHLAVAGLAVASLRRLLASSSVYRRIGEFRDTPIGFSLIRACQRALPLLTGSGLYVANLLRDGADLWEYGLPVGWGLLMGVTIPVTRSLNLHALLPATDNTPALEAAPEQPRPPANYAEAQSQKWANAKATGTTLLTGVHQYQEGFRDFWGIVVAEAGETVPDLNPTALAGVFDLPPGTVTLSLIEGSGPGRKLLEARPTLNQLEQAHQHPLERLFNEKLARPNGGADGMHLVDYRSEPNRIAFLVTAPEDQFIQLNQKQIARSLKYKDTSLIMIETDGLADGHISVYKTHPLMNIREATIEDLTMRDDGTIQNGLRPDGRAARVPLFDPVMGAITDLYVGAPGAGKSVALNHVLAAERISGIVSIVADAQNGMSIPEADGRVYHFGKGIAATAATLAAFKDLAKYREDVGGANGWGSFEPGQPWRIANATLDELNRILSADADVPRPFRKWVTGNVGDAQSTGRKVGMGIRFAAQSIHLADLGDKDRVRANAKNGTVWLGRTNSSTTQHMAADGVLPPGIYPEPIPRYFKTETAGSIEAAFEGKEAKHGPITAGMANVIQGGSVFLERVFYARKENKTYPGLIALYESAPIPTLTPEEHKVFQEAYAKWLPHAELLLAGEDEEGGSEYAGYAGDARDLLEDEDDQPSSGSIKDRILDLLADGPMALRDVRKRMEDVAPGSVNNAMAELREACAVTPVNRGTYQLAN